MSSFNNEKEMHVTKRNGSLEIVSFDKILQRIKKIGKDVNLPCSFTNEYGPLNNINYTSLAMKVIDQLYDGITTTQIDELSSEQCASMSSVHPDYSVLAGRIMISNHHRNTTQSFVKTVKKLFGNVDQKGTSSPLVSLELYNFVISNSKIVEDICDYSRDYFIDYFGFKTLQRTYLIRQNTKVVERPQHMWLRVSIGIHGTCIEKIKETYELLSKKYMTHATPTLFNAGTSKPQLSSCFLLAMEDDSIDGIYNTLKDCALISKWAGGVGLHIHNVRATGSHINGTNGTSNGIVPMLKVFNNTAKYVDQGGGKRNGSFAIYLEPWHADIEKFLQLRKNHGDEELKARDLFYALWVPDLFMKRIKDDGLWTLMCPNECPGLSDVYGDEFEKLYMKYESDGKGRCTISARQLWLKVLDAQMETGTPYICYKDASNRKSNQQNLGTIKSSNLCVAPETKILTDKGHIEIQTLEGQLTNVWNGNEFSEVQIFKTGENQKLIEVHTSDNCILSCTPYHKFFIQKENARSPVIVVEAQNLQEGDKIMKCDYPVIDGTQRMLYPYTHGFFCGDGTYRYTVKGKELIRCTSKCLEDRYFCGRHIFHENANILKSHDESNTQKEQCNGMKNNKIPLSFLYADKKKLHEFMDYSVMSEDDTRMILTLPLDIEDKFFVPLNHTLQQKMEWFAGYVDADGSISNNGTNQQLQTASVNKDFCMDIKLMLQTCGINPKLSLMREKGVQNLPDGKGGKKDFITQPLYRLLITSIDLLKLVKIGFKPKRLLIHNQTIPDRSACHFIKIDKVIDNGRIDNTFCFTEPKQNAGIFNGILTSQCTEIILYSDHKESAVCNLASIALPSCVDFTTTPPSFNFELLHKIVKVVTYNLNRVIDINFYPTEKTRVSNFRHRPLGIGVQGLADVFLLLNMAFTSTEARLLNKQIFETLYHGALERSCELAEEYGPYETYEGSPASQGKLQFDLWEAPQNDERHDWTLLKSKIRAFGIRNSVLLAPMPTASTSQILGYNECIEPITSNIYSRRTLAGEFILTNKYLMNDLIKLGVWNDAVKNHIIANNGSVQGIDIIPIPIKEKYKTVWELPMKSLIDMAVDRGVYICQSQSLNLWMEDPAYNSLTSMHFYTWSKGLKTGIYYLRRRAKHQAQQFTIEPKKGISAANAVCEDDEICLTCSA
jgi:ribonucleoside-diphosphate reductase alpha chain